ncbi:MAG: DUF6713 family protein [Cytophagales bacterium]|nr:DUF6713 family protein [Cytophagales bacterium]
MDFFTLGLSFILLHELDAIRCHEWRMFPLTSFLPERTGMIVFLYLHIPLFYWILLPSTLNDPTFKYGFSIFLIVHCFLHIGFLWHKKNEFKDWISWSLIILAALCGMLHLLDL